VQLLLDWNDVGPEFSEALEFATERSRSRGEAMATLSTSASKRWRIKRRKQEFVDAPKDDNEDVRASRENQEQEEAEDE
jgi:hypothetical protein